MSRPTSSEFVETLEYRRFAEFCDACCRYRYIGLCYGPPGVGKTLSGRRYARWDQLEKLDPLRVEDDVLTQLLSAGPPHSIFYTPPVLNSPRSLLEEINQSRSRLYRLVREPLQREHQAEFEMRQREFDSHRHDTFSHIENLYRDTSSFVPPMEPPFADIALEFARRAKAIPDPTSLLIVDEGDRLKMTSLEAIRDIFDQEEIGLVLIGMPGLEKRLARYPQFYSRIGFVHEFRPLGVAQMCQLLAQPWTPAGVQLPPLEEEAIVAIIRVTGGNFRLLHRLLTQAERIARINEMPAVNAAVVEAARESLVIGQM